MTNPFRGSINNTSNVTALTSVMDDDDLGFNGYNEDLQEAGENRREQAQQPAAATQAKANEKETDPTHRTDEPTTRSQDADIPEQHPQSNENNATNTTDRNSGSSAYCDATGAVVERRSSK